MVKNNTKKVVSATKKSVKPKTSKKEDLSLDTLTSTIRKASIDNNINNAVLYLRSSTPGQNKEENNQHSLLSQRIQCMDYAKKHNLNIIETIEDVRRANDIKKLKINKIPDDYANINLIIADSSRMSRDLADGALFMKRCVESNIIIHLVRNDSVSNTILGTSKIMNGVIYANHESNIMRERIKSSNQVKRKFGSKFGRVPYGLKLKKKIVKYNEYNYPINDHISNDEEQKIIKLIGWLRFGCEINTFYKLFRSIIDNPTKKLYYQDKEWTDIKYKECTLDYIATILNHHNILKKGEKWTIARVASVLKKIPVKDRKPFGMSVECELELESSDSETELEEVIPSKKTKTQIQTHTLAQTKTQTSTNINKQVLNKNNKKTDIVQDNDFDFNEFLNSNEDLNEDVVSNVITKENNNQLVKHRLFGIQSSDINTNNSSYSERTLEYLPVMSNNKVNKDSSKSSNTAKKYLNSKIDKIKSIFDNMLGLIKDDDSDSE